MRLKRVINQLQNYINALFGRLTNFAFSEMNRDYSSGAKFLVALRIVFRSVFVPVIPVTLNGNIVLGQENIYVKSPNGVFWNKDNSSGRQSILNRFLDCVWFYAVMAITRNRTILIPISGRMNHKVFATPNTGFRVFGYSSNIRTGAGTIKIGIPLFATTSAGNFFSANLTDKCYRTASPKMALITTDAVSGSASTRTIMRSKSAIHNASICNSTMLTLQSDGFSKPIVMSGASTGTTLGATSKRTKAGSVFSIKLNLEYLAALLTSYRNFGWIHRYMIPQIGGEI